MFDVRSEFKQLNNLVGGNPLTYLDSAATTLKPKVMVDRFAQYLQYEASNVHRGAHYYSNQATQNYEHTRASVAKFLNSKSEEIIFTHGTTDSVNLVAKSLKTLISADHLKDRNEILLSEMEHHSNIVPWYLLAKELGLVIKTIPFNSDGQLDLSDLNKLINHKTLIVSLVHMSNTFGSINPVEKIFAYAKENGALTFLDAAQSVSFLPLDVYQLKCDFLTFSTHKLFGPEGLGFLYGKYELLEKLNIYRGGGSMISKVDFNEITFLPPPQKFEAGTPNIGAVIAFAESLKFFLNLGYQNIQDHEINLMKYCIEGLSDIEGFKPLGDVQFKKNILSFNIEGLHPADVGSIVDQMGVAIRVGHHCTQPLMSKLNISSSLRASFSIYNNIEDCDRLIRAVKKAKELLND